MGETIRTREQKYGPLAGKPDAPNTFAATPRAEGMVPPIYVQSPDEVEKLSPGTRFRTPKGEVLTRPYDVQDDTSWQEVPLGAPYREGGKTRLKYEADALHPGAQSLYEMAHDPAGQKKALEYWYGPGSVKEDRGEVYVEQDGKRRSPKSGTAGGMASRAAGYVGSQVAPTGGAIAGGIAGGRAGGVAAPLGAAVGGGIGEAINQGLLRWLGVEKLGLGESAGAIGSGRSCG